MSGRAVYAADAQLSSAAAVGSDATREWVALPSGEDARFPFKASATTPLTLDVLALAPSAAANSFRVDVIDPAAPVGAPPEWTVNWDVPPGPAWQWRLLDLSAASLSPGLWTLSFTALEGGAKLARLRVRSGSVAFAMPSAGVPGGRGGVRAGLSWRRGFGVDWGQPEALGRRIEVN